MSEQKGIAAQDRTLAPLDRRGFFRTAGAGLGAARSGDAAMIAGYLGASEIFYNAMPRSM